MDKKYRVSYSTEGSLTSCNMRFTDCEYQDMLADAIRAYWSHFRQGRGASIFVWNDDKSEHVEMDCVLQARIRDMLQKDMWTEDIAAAMEKDLGMPKT